MGTNSLQWPYLISFLLELILEQVSARIDISVLTNIIQILPPQSRAASVKPFLFYRESIKNTFCTKQLPSLASIHNCLVNTFISTSGQPLYVNFHNLSDNSIQLATRIQVTATLGDISDITKHNSVLIKDKMFSVLFKDWDHV